jgi:hypothetical protein
VAPLIVLCKSHQEKEQEEGRSGVDGGKIERELSEVNNSAVSGG